MTLGDKIKKARIGLSITQIELAEKVGVNQSNIALWENGKRHPKPKHLQKLAEILNRDLSYFGRETDHQILGKTFAVPIVCDIKEGEFLYLKDDQQRIKCLPWTLFGTMEALPEEVVSNQAFCFVYQEKNNIIPVDVWVLGFHFLDEYGFSYKDLVPQNDIALFGYKEKAVVEGTSIEKTIEVILARQFDSSFQPISNSPSPDKLSSPLGFVYSYMKLPDNLPLD